MSQHDKTPEGGTRVQRMESSFPVEKLLEERLYELKMFSPEILREALNREDLSNLADALKMGSDSDKYHDHEFDVGKWSVLKGQVTKAINSGANSQDIVKIIDRAVKVKGPEADSARELLLRSLVEAAVRIHKESEKVDEPSGVSEFIKSEKLEDSSEAEAAAENADEGGEVESAAAGKSVEVAAAEAAEEAAERADDSEEVVEADSDFDHKELLDRSFGADSALWVLNAKALTLEEKRKLLDFLNAEKSRVEKAKKDSGSTATDKMHALEASAASAKHIENLREALEKYVADGVDGGEGLLVGAEGGQAAEVEGAEGGIENGLTEINGSILDLRNEAESRLTELEGTTVSAEVLGAFKDAITSFDNTLKLEGAEKILVEGGLIDEGAKIPSLFESGDNREFYIEILQNIEGDELPDNKNLLDLGNELKGEIEKINVEYLKAQSDAFEKLDELIDAGQPPYSQVDLEKLRSAYYVMSQGMSSPQLVEYYAPRFVKALDDSIEAGGSEAEIAPEFEATQEKLLDILGRLGKHIRYEIAVSKSDDEIDGEPVLEQFRIIERVLSDYADYLGMKADRGENIAVQLAAFDEFLTEFGGVHVIQMQEMASSQASQLSGLDKKIAAEIGEDADRAAVLEAVSGNFHEFRGIIDAYFLAQYLTSEIDNLDSRVEDVFKADLDKTKGDRGAREARLQVSMQLRDLWHEINAAARSGDAEALRDLRTRVEEFPAAKLKGLEAFRAEMDAFNNIDDIIEQFEAIAGAVEEKLEKLRDLNKIKAFESLQEDLLVFEKLIEELDAIQDEEENRNQILAISEMAKNLIKRSKIEMPKTPDGKTVDLDNPEIALIHDVEADEVWHIELSDEEVADYQNLFMKLEAKIDGRKSVVASDKVSEDKKKLAQASMEALQGIERYLRQRAGEGLYDESEMQEFWNVIENYSSKMLAGKIGLEKARKSQGVSDAAAKKDVAKNDSQAEGSGSAEEPVGTEIATVSVDNRAEAGSEEELAEAEKYADEVLNEVAARREFMSDEESAAFNAALEKLRQLSVESDPEAAKALLAGIKAELGNIAKDKGGLSWTGLIAAIKGGRISSVLEKLIPEKEGNSEKGESFDSIMKHFETSLDSMPRGNNIKADEIDWLKEALSELKANFNKDIDGLGRDLTDEESRQKDALLTAFESLEVEYANFKKDNSEKGKESGFAGRIDHYRNALGGMPGADGLSAEGAKASLDDLYKLRDGLVDERNAVGDGLSEDDEKAFRGLMSDIKSLEAEYQEVAKGDKSEDLEVKVKKEGSLFAAFKSYFTGNEKIVEDMEFTKAQTGAKVVANVAYSLSNIFGGRALGEAVRKGIQEWNFSSEREAVTKVSAETVDALFKQLDSESADIEAERQSAIQKLVARVENSEYLTKEEKDQYKQRVESIVKTTDVKMEEARGVLKSHLDQVAKDYMQARLTWAHVGMDAMAAAGSAVGFWGLGEAMTGSSEAGRALARAAFGTASIGRVGLNEGYTIAQEERVAVLEAYKSGETVKQSSAGARFMYGLARPWKDLFTSGKRARGAGGVASELMGLFGLASAAYAFDGTPGSIDALMSGESSNTDGLSDKDLEELYPGESLRGEAGSAPTTEDADDCIKKLIFCCENDNGSSMADIGVEAGPSTGVEWSAEDISNFAVKRGDGVTTVLYRQIEANPDKFGFDPSTDGDLEKWSRRLATKIAKDNGVFFEGGYTGVKGSAIGKLSLMLEKKPDGSWGFDEYDAVTGKKMADSEISKYLYDYYPPEEVDVVPSGNPAESVEAAKVVDLSDEIDAIPSPEVPDVSAATEAAEPASTGVDSGDLAAQRAALQEAERLKGASGNIDKLAEDGKLSATFRGQEAASEWATVDVSGNRINIRPILREMRPNGRGGELNQVAQLLKDEANLSTRKAKIATAAWSLIYDEINGVEAAKLNEVIARSTVASQLKENFFKDIEPSKIQDAFKKVAGAK